ncbi:hypothetical protein LTR36_001107 [Oleoguttula mirabilis]|uniref:Nitrogen permease regulator 3 n=1 Tax=Oleoguttula mirabilis TaxID=1507867 RepID=A0AAV9JPS1_9PEZI|nr:hypothetical protein LTR36_001107 [Oleoguttula mirabilis]
MKRSNGLIAVLILTRSKPGPKLVFHYPAEPQLVGSNSCGEHNDCSDSELEYDEEPEREGSGRDSPREVTSLVNTVATQPERSFSHDANGHSDSDSVLGYHVDSLEKLLSPGRWSARKKFEICLDGITFVGHPVYASDNGSWSTQDHGTPAEFEAERVTTPTLGRLQTSTDCNEAAPTSKANVTIAAPETVGQAAHDFTHIPESLDSQRGLSLATSMTSTSTASGALAEQMTMFHVVFAHQPHRQSVTSDVYQHVAKKLAKALHYCQKQTNYVGVECRRLLAIKAKAKHTKMPADESLKQMLEGSGLAWALKEVFERVSAGEIAGIRLNGMELSVQIPQVEASTSDGKNILGPHTGLLLLEDKDVLLRQLSHSDASPLAYFIREHAATKSLQKQSTSLNMPFRDVQYLARHLIKWRKAQIIAPLHRRNMYTSNSEAPIDQIRKLMPVYGQRFASLPSLPQMLKVLSGKPIQYGLVIPSRDHRAPYMEILAFLIRHRFVMQLKTYGWLKADPSPYNSLVRSSKAKSKRPVSGVSLLSPHGDEDSMSVSSERTAIPISDVQADNMTFDKPSPDEFIIFDPSHPTEDESAMLEHIRESIPDPELRERFSQLLPYFDGEHAFEEIAAEEAMKRAKVEEWAALLDREGHLLTFRSV